MEIAVETPTSWWPKSPVASHGGTGSGCLGEFGGGDVMVIDLRPGPGFAQMGWAVHDSGGDFTDPWPSLAAYLQATADALRYGIDAKGHVPVPDGGR